MESEKVMMYANCITRIEAQELLALIPVTSFGDQNKSGKSKTEKRLTKLAFPPEEQKYFSSEIVAKSLMRAFG